MTDDFLARENEFLGGTFSPSAGGQLSGNADDIDFDRAASAFPDIGIDGDIPPIPQPTTSNNHGGFGFDMGSLISPPAQQEIKVTGDDEINKFESAFPDLEPIPQQTFSPLPPQQSVSFSAPAFAPRPQASAGFSTPILQAPIEDEEEPEVIKKWREQQAESIRQRDEASAQRRKENIAKAESSIDVFYEEYNAKKERQIKENKESEATYLAALTDSLSAGTTWSRICDLIELENSQSKTLARTGAGTTDLTRYREILLRLKREGTAAPGAGGY
ncbi:clathrin light chain-domain-containing protein [Gautieria morchelliformis]|nr:clathrin light chain-domain-containing protein [Gautieria morchelliformis]